MTYEQFTDRARQAMALAADVARQWQHPYIGTEHMLIGLIDQGGGRVAEALGAAGVGQAALRKAVEDRVARGAERVADGDLPQTPRAKQAITHAADEARRMGHAHVGPAHLLLGLVRVEDGVAAQALGAVTPLDALRDHVVRLLGSEGDEDASASQEALREAMVRFWRQFGILVSSGVPALRALAVEQHELPIVRGALTRVAEAVRNGRTLSEAIAAVPKLFATPVVAMCRAGEAGDVLQVVAEPIAKGLETGALPLSGDPGAAAGPTDAPATNWGQRVVDLIGAGVRAGASDVHFEPTRDGGRVRHRIDGVVQTVGSMPQEEYDAVVGRLKVLASLNVAEHRLPQDGRIQMEVDQRQLDLRVSVCQYATGPSVVIRVLDRAAVPLDIGQLGCSPETLDALSESTRRPYGLHVVAGPTGCGKTTLLYALLHLLNTPDRKILTVEDPVEFLLDGVLQAPVRPDTGLTFPRLVRAFLRQAPNVIMVGEIRDQETANVVVQASLTGHLLFTTLHTQNACEVPERLVDIGLDPWLVSMALEGAASIRLARRVCPECAEPFTPDASLVDAVLAGLSDADTLRGSPFVHGRGCDHCHGTGYRGRTGVFEVLPMTPDTRAMIRAGTPSQELRRLAVDAGMVTLRHDGVRKAAQGITTLEEVLRVTTL